jgi:hypothetical protein
VLSLNVWYKSTNVIYFMCQIMSRLLPLESLVTKQIQQKIRGD